MQENQKPTPQRFESKAAIRDFANEKGQPIDLKMISKSRHMFFIKVPGISSMTWLPFSPGSPKEFTGDGAERATALHNIFNGSNVSVH